MTGKDKKEHLKEKLNRYRHLESERVQIYQELKRIDCFMKGPRGINMDGMPGSTCAGDPVQCVVSQHIALQERYQKQLAKLATAQADIENMIECLEPMSRTLMRYRYIDGMSWEEVCVAIGYSWRQTHNIHAKALDAIIAREEAKQ